jgi:hypothetical protein
MQPHVGMKLWFFDQNRRIYPRNADGRTTGSAIWREHWREVEIKGETTRSWIISYTDEKVPKKDFPGRYATSQEDIDRNELLNNSHRIARKVGECRDYDTLLAIKKLLEDYETKKQNKEQI